MNRRQLLKLLLSGAAGHTLDIDRLLWIPGAKTFFLPSVRPATVGEIVALEYERIAPKIKQLFERDDVFYANIRRRDLTVISSRDMRIPLRLEEK